VIAFITEETLIIVLEMDPAAGQLVLILIALAAIFSGSPASADSTPFSAKFLAITIRSAAPKHFIPFYNFGLDLPLAGHHVRLFESAATE